MLDQTRRLLQAEHCQFVEVVQLLSQRVLTPLQCAFVNVCAFPACVSVCYTRSCLVISQHSVTYAPQPFPFSSQHSDVVVSSQSQFAPVLLQRSAELRFGMKSCLTMHNAQALKFAEAVAAIAGQPAHTEVVTAAAVESATTGAINITPLESDMPREMGEGC